MAAPVFNKESLSFSGNRTSGVPKKIMLFFFETFLVEYCFFSYCRDHLLLLVRIIGQHRRPLATPAVPSFGRHRTDIIHAGHDTATTTFIGLPNSQQMININVNN